MKITLDGNPTSTSIRQDILEAIGYVGQIRKAKAAELDRVIKEAFGELDVRLLVVDEAGHLVPSSRRRNEDRLGGAAWDTLKRLHEELKIGFVFVGTPVVGEMVRSDSQFNSRWGEAPMRHYQNDQSWNGLLGALDQALPFEQSAGLNSRESSNAFFAATGGNLRLLKRLVAEAVLLGARRSDQKLEIDYVAKAFDLLGYRGTNPFRGLS
ncbi:hypothetical protein GCM10010970_24390 [Silvimonas iriomotensis]|uniref:TniB protein n=2 Tax=Silvimonas TaxID=300264 RepID=A0ABQ2PB41_9NEIS|nr:hypothetical protein GCM10010970_24390 [Silvimonas iriomotensis]GGP26117.1 hypothetical protein GCM10010971_19360 [Silvimonas amylolytica]